MKGKSVSIFIIISFLLFISPGNGEEFRRINPIPTPSRKARGVRTVPPAKYRPIPARELKKQVEKIFSNWNRGDISKYLSEDFYDKTRLIDNMYEKVPRDAKVRVLSVGETQIMGQQRIKIPGGERIISTVSVTATTQIEFNDPERGYRRLEGQNEYIIKVTEEMR